MSETLSKIELLSLNNISSDNSRFKLVFGEKLAILGALNSVEFSKQPRLIFLDLSLYHLENLEYQSESRIDKSFIRKIECLDSTFMTEKANLFVECRNFLADDGYLAIKVNGPIKSPLKLSLDRIFGINNFINEIIINSPFKLVYRRNSQVFESTNYILLYSKGSNHIINPMLNEKVSGGYWHSFVSKGQGKAKKFIFDQEEVILSPPPGTHWKLKQENIFKLCSQGKIRLNRKRSPEYWVPLKKGQIIDTNWLDISSYSLLSEQIINSSYLFERLLGSCLNRGDIFFNLSLDSHLSFVVANNLHLELIGIKNDKSFIETITIGLRDKEIDVSMYELLSNKIDKVRKPQFNLLRLNESEPSNYTENKTLHLVEVFPIDNSEKKTKTIGDWENILVHGDCLEVVNVLSNKIISQVKLIYIDPPFFTGTDENIIIPVRKNNNESEIIQTHDLAYYNTLKDSNPVNYFIKWFKDRITLMRALLREDGFIFVRFDYHFGHYARMVLDEVFGQKNFVNEFLIRRMKKNLSRKQAYRQKHLINHFDYLFVYGMSSKARLKTEKINKKRRKNQDEAEIQYLNDNLWIDIAGYEKAKKTLYPTENSESLLKRVIQIASNKGDTIADFFCGSGTTLAIAEKLGRKWIGVDIGHYAMHESKKRILKDPERSQFSYYSLKSSTFMFNEIKENNNKIRYLSFKTEDSSVIHLEINQRKSELELQILDFVPYQKDQLLLDHKDSDSVAYINYIDYWMINWKYEREMFSVDWYSIREIKGKKVLRPVKSLASYKYSKAGNYIIATSIVDVFGNIMLNKFSIRI